MKYLALALVMFTAGCHSEPKSESVVRRAPTPFEVKYHSDITRCYANGFDSSWFCIGMASSMANSYIQEHPELLRDPADAPPTEAKP